MHLDLLLALGQKALAEAVKAAPEGWMIESTTSQLKKLAPLLEPSPLRFIRAK